MIKKNWIAGFIVSVFIVSPVFANEPLAENLELIPTQTLEEAESMQRMEVPQIDAPALVEGDPFGSFLDDSGIDDIAPSEEEVNPQEAQESEPAEPEKTEVTIVQSGDVPYDIQDTMDQVLEVLGPVKDVKFGGLNHYGPNFNCGHFAGEACAIAEDFFDDDIEIHFVGTGLTALNGDPGLLGHHFNLIYLGQNDDDGQHYFAIYEPQNGNHIIISTHDYPDDLADLITPDTLQILYPPDKYNFLLDGVKVY